MSSSNVPGSANGARTVARTGVINLLIVWSADDRGIDSHQIRRVLRVGKGGKRRKPDVHRLGADAIRRRPAAPAAAGIDHAPA